ncbi:MAG TPA: hypothetical protein VGF08_01265 [Terriglobales bacterium]
MKPLLALIALLVMSVALTLSSNLVAAQSATPKAENQPHMNDALNHLQEAQKALEAGSSDKGGHRVKAISLVKQAMSEVQQGIQFDNTHQEKAQPK